PLRGKSGWQILPVKFPPGQPVPAGTGRKRYEAQISCQDQRRAEGKCSGSLQKENRPRFRRDRAPKSEIVRPTSSCRNRPDPTSACSIRDRDLYRAGNRVLSPPIGWCPPASPPQKSLTQKAAGTTECPRCESQNRAGHRENPRRAA